MTRRLNRTLTPAIAGSLLLGVGLTAKADDVTRASAAEFWTQHANAYTWTLGQGANPIVVATPPVAAEPYALSGNAQRRPDAAQFWSTYPGRTINVGNAVVVVPTAR